jgi:alkyldihydroxyacetonephosphate synthase
MSLTGGHRRLSRFWGWGYADEELAPAELGRLKQLAAGLGGGAGAASSPRLEDYALPEPRLKPPPALGALLSATPYDRVSHAYGKSFADMTRMLMRHLPHPPDLVAFPRCEQDLSDVMSFAAGAGAAVIPFGGGTSVCGGVETDVGGDYNGVISVDLQYLNRVLEVDETSRAALIEGGALGPELEHALKPHGLTLRHFPQSFQFSTLGGWLATRAGGHFASNYTHIDDFVESIRMLTPSGVLESRRLPGSGAGPSPDRLMLGSEGTLGFITRAWMRLQARPRFRGSASVSFPDFATACEAVRLISQAGLFPSNCRLLDPVESMVNGVGDGKTSLLVLAFESADHPLDAWLNRALEIAADCGGRWDAEAVKRSLNPPRDEDSGGPEHRQGAAGEWRRQFLRAPYYRNFLTPAGIMADTFETAITWDRFEEFHAGVRERVGAAMRAATGAEGVLSCRFTHVYPDGAAPYFTFYARGTRDSGTAAGLANMLARWRDIKRAANAAVTDLGGTITHHHAVGRDHQPYGYERQVPPLFRAAFAGARQALDPVGMMNPGVLVETPARSAVARGVMRESVDSRS